MRKILISLTFFFGISSLMAQTENERPNIEALQRALQERYLVFMEAAATMQVSFEGTPPEYLKFPSRASDGKSPGAFPEDCFYEKDLYDPETGQLDMDRLYRLLADTLGLMYTIPEWGEYWVHPSWHDGFAGEVAVDGDGTGKIRVIKNLEEHIGYPTVAPWNYINIFNQMVEWVNMLEVMHFSFAGDPTNDVVTSKEGAMGLEKDSFSQAKTSAETVHNQLQATNMGGSDWISPGRHHYMKAFENQLGEDTWQGQLDSRRGRLKIDYNSMDEFSGKFQIYAFLYSENSGAKKVSRLSTDGAPSTQYDEWFFIDEFSFSSGGIYTSAYYGDHDSSFLNVVDPGVGSEDEFDWLLRAKAIIRPNMQHYASADLVACSDACGLCTEEGGLCNDLEFGSLSFSLGLGKDSEGSAGSMRLHMQTISPLSGSPFNLNLNLGTENAVVLKDGDYDGILRQVVTDQVLVDIEVTNPHREYIVRYYDNASKGSVVNGFYNPDPLDSFKTVTFSNPGNPAIEWNATLDYQSATDEYFLDCPSHGLTVGNYTFVFFDGPGSKLPTSYGSGELKRSDYYIIYAQDADTLRLLYDLSTYDVITEMGDNSSVILRSIFPFGTLNITEQSGTQTRSISYSSNTTSISDDHTITLSDIHNGKTSNYESVLINDTSSPVITIGGIQFHSKFSITKTDSDSSGNIIEKTKTTYQRFAWNEPHSPARADQAEVVEIVVDPDGAARTTTYTYYDDQVNDGDNYSRVKSITYPDGMWEAFEYATQSYDLDGQTNYLHYRSKTYRPYKDSTLSFPLSLAGNTVEAITRGTITDSDGDTEVEHLETRLTTIDGQEVNRTYIVSWSDTSSGLSAESEISTLQPGATWDAANNLRTDRWTYFDGDFNGALAKVKTPDGNIQLYSYSVDSASNEKTTTIKEGQSNLAEDDVIDGLQTVTVVSPLGGQVSQTITDIVSGIVISDEDTITVDDLGRPTLVSYLDGTSESFLYEDCCGNLTVTDRTGLSTTTNKDMDGTVASVVTNGITTSYSEGYDSDNTDGVVGFTKTIITDGRGAADTVVTRIDTFNPAGELIASIDPRDSVNRITKFSESVNASGQLEKLTTLPNTAVQKNVYHKDGSLYQEYFDGVLIREYDYAVVSDTHDGFSFNAKTEKVIRLGPNGETTEWVKTYADMLGRVYKIETPDMDNSGANGFALTYFNDKGQREKQVDPDGLNTLYKYNDKGELEDVVLSDDDTIDYSGTDRITRTTRSVVDDPTNGEVVREIMSVWENDGSDTATVTQTTDTSTDGLDIWTTRYGQLTHLHRTYNGLGSVTDVETRPDTTTATTTTINGFRTSYTVSNTEEGTLIDFSYVPDDFDRLHTETNDLLAATTTYTYWDTGALKQVATPESATGAGDAQTTTYAYNVMGQVTDITLSGNKVKSSRYHPDGNLKMAFGEGTYPVEYTYDRQGRMKTMKTWKNFNTATETGVSGSAITTWNYNELGLLEEKLDNDSKGAVYAYTDAGRLSSKEWARIGHDGTNPVKAVYTYGTTGSTKADLLNIDYQNDNGVTKDVTHTYDRLGWTKDIFDASGKRTLSYEDGVLADETYSDDGDPGTEDPFLGMVIDRKQDSYNRLDEIKVLDPQASQLYKAEYGYDDASRLETAIFGANSVTYAYTPAATTRQTLTYHNGTSYVMTVDRDFDKMDRQASQSAAITGDDTHSYSYTYNDLNQRTHVTLARGEYWHYGYDSLGQVDSAVKKTSVGSAIPGYSYGFTFDHIGNRTDSTINGRTDSYTPNLLNQYTSRNISRAIDVRGSALSSATVTVDGQATTRTGDHFYKEIDLSAETSPNDARTVDYLVTATLPDGGYNNTPRVADVEGEEFLKANPESFDYNDDGNLLFDGKWDYTWNAENRLIQAVTKSSAVTAGAPNLKLAFAYDSQGRRFQKDVYEHDGSEYVLRETKYFIYDGWNLIAELDADLDLKNSYVWGTDLSGSLQGAGGVGGLLFAYDSWTGVIAAPWFDGNGNAMGYLDMADGSVVADYEYGALGEQVRSTGPMANALSFRFSTKYLDTELDLLYYGYRYYSPESGRWLTPDPIAESGGLNVYSITENNPISKIDALGLYSLKDARKSLEQRGEKKLGSQVGGSHTKMYSNQQVFDEWYRLEKSRGSWWTSLPKCPIKLCITRGEGRNRKTRYAENSYAKNKENWHDPKRPSNAELNLHPGTYFSMRSKADSHGHANQCTYDRDGNLLRFAPGSGTVDWYRSGTATHYDHDVAPAYLANRLDGGANMGVVSSTITGGPSILGSPGHNLRKYYEVRPLWAESKE